RTNFYLCHLRPGGRQATSGVSEASRGAFGRRGSPLAVVPTRSGPLMALPPLAAGLADLGADIAEGVIGVGAQRRDRRDAHDDNQGQHDGVLDRGRAVFVLQEVNQVLTELTHGASSL